MKINHLLTNNNSTNINVLGIPKENLYKDSVHVSNYNTFISQSSSSPSKNLDQLVYSNNIPKHLISSEKVLQLLTNTHISEKKNMEEVKKQVVEELLKTRNTEAKITTISDNTLKMLKIETR